MTDQQIRDKTGRPAIAEGIAEECAELCKEALKYARAIRGENPTPVPAGESFQSMRAELSDLLVYCSALDVTPDLELMHEKRARWIERLNGGSDDGKGKEPECQAMA